MVSNCDEAKHDHLEAVAYIMALELLRTQVSSVMSMSNVFHTVKQD